MRPVLDGLNIRGLTEGWLRGLDSRSSTLGGPSPGPERKSPVPDPGKNSPDSGIAGRDGWEVSDLAVETRPTLNREEYRDLFAGYR